ncbi:MAG TPA: cysteine desulfurase family protein [Rhizomicrobium sp.]|jgi:cysteine desulfurase
MPDAIYLDNQATTPTDPRVRDALSPLLEVSVVGNPHSDHIAGRRIAQAVERARAQIASLIGAQPPEIVFTSGATEANNLAIQGLARSPGRRGNHLITCATEHKCVLEAAAFLGRSGFSVNVLPVDRDGLVNVAQLADTITDDTFLVTIMTANNEIGVLQPIAEIADVCKSRGVAFHSDAAQAVGKIPVNVRELGIDMLSLSGHKLYAPIGIGALYISSEMPAMPEPLILGGGQERGLRSGTLPAHLCVGFGEACEIAVDDREEDARRAIEMRDAFLSIVTRHVPDARINGHTARRLPGNLSLTLPGVDADHLVGGLQPDIAVSTNAACSSGVLMPSHVLRALGLTESDAASTIRIGFGRFNTLRQVQTAAERLGEAAIRIRCHDKLWTAPA